MYLSFSVIVSTQCCEDTELDKNLCTQNKNIALYWDISLCSPKNDSNDSNLQDLSERRHDNIRAWVKHWHRFLTGRKCNKNTRLSVSPLNGVLNKLDYSMWLWALLYSKKIEDEIPSQPPVLIPTSVSFLCDTRPPSHVHVILVARQRERNLNVYERERSGSEYRMQAVCKLWF